jgi:hypothetical protein
MVLVLIFLCLDMFKKYLNFTHDPDWLQYLPALPRRSIDVHFCRSLRGVLRSKRSVEVSLRARNGYTQCLQYTEYSLRSDDGTVL